MYYEIRKTSPEGGTVLAGYVLVCHGCGDTARRKPAEAERFTRSAGSGPTCSPSVCGGWAERHDPNYTDDRTARSRGIVVNYYCEGCVRAGVTAETVRRTRLRERKMVDVRRRAAEAQRTSPAGEAAAVGVPPAVTPEILAGWERAIVAGAEIPVMHERYGDDGYGRTPMAIKPVGLRYESRDGGVRYAWILRYRVAGDAGERSDFVSRFACESAKTAKARAARERRAARVEEAEANRASRAPARVDQSCS